MCIRDSAWGDVSYQTEEAGEDGSEESGTEAGERREQVDYDFFLVTTEQISRTHTADPVFPLPECVSLTDNYYVCLLYTSTLYFIITS